MYDLNLEQFESAQSRSYYLVMYIILVVYLYFLYSYLYVYFISTFVECSTCCIHLTLLGKIM